MTSINTMLNDFTTAVQRHWSTTPPYLRNTAVASLSVLSLLTISFLGGYRQWLAIGAGGLPYNLKGYLMNLAVEWRYAAGDTVGLQAYERKEAERRYEKWDSAGEEEREVVMKGKFLKGELPDRGGVRARAKKFVIPQRERSLAEFGGDEKIRNTYLKAFDATQTANSSTTEWRTSVLERRGKAIFLKPNKPLRTLDQQTQREICHIHGSDLSGHVTLSLADAKEVVAKEWGERHRLSGTKFLPLGYTMMYCPRSMEEVEVYCKIFQAGIDYLTSAE